MKEPLSTLILVKPQARQPCQAAGRRALAADPGVAAGALEE
ncbi:hypothetical protein [Bordetella ansorpii]|nr:hypothetical protein [Bordetella ansorpii]